eukprot:529840-Ditylum_brightwellii.AAC.1
MDLIKHKQEHGNCLVPRSSPNKRLASWVHNQRNNLKHVRNDPPDDVRAERISKLNKIGFAWAPRAELQMSESKESEFIPPKSRTSFLSLTKCKNSKNTHSPKRSISPNASFQRGKESFTTQNYKQDIWYEQYMELVKYKQEN